MTMKTIQNAFAPLLKLALPLAVTGLIQSGTFFFETLFLARLGTDILAAGALVNWLFATFIVIIFGALSSINILVSHKYGANDKAGISLVVRDGFWLAVLMAVPAVILFWYMSPVFLVFGQSPAIVKLADAYLHALTWGILPNFIIFALIDVIIGLGHTRIIVKYSVLSVALTIFLSYALIFGKFGLPALGIAGAGWGVSISYWIMLLVLISYLFFTHTYTRYFSHLLVFDKPSYLLELLRTGMPMGIMYFVEVGFFFVLTLMMGWMGSQLLAANQIAMQYMGMLMQIIFSVAQAITVRMGHLLGSGQKQAAEKAGYAGVILSCLLMLIVAIIYWFFPKPLIAIDFNVNKAENAGLVAYAIQLFAISALFQIFEAMRIAFFGALRSLKDTNFTLLISVLGFWIIALPSGYLLAWPMHLGGPGLWWGMVLGALSSCLLLWWRFHIKIRQF